MNKYSQNKAIIIGRLGQNPEQKTLQSGMIIVNFSLATTDTRKDKSGQFVDETEWHNCVAFGKTAEIIGKYWQKGQLVHVVGKLKTSTWKDNQNITHYKTDIIVNEAVQLQRSDIKPDNANPTQTHQQQANATQVQNPHGENDEELPF